MENLDKTDMENLPITTGIIGLFLTIIISVRAYISASFRDKREARELEEKRQEKERFDNISRAVKEGMESYNKEIRRELNEFKIGNEARFKEVHGRIDDVFKELKK